MSVKKPICRNAAVVGLIIGLAVAGCGKATRSPIVEVTGTIQFEDGSKLPEGTMIVLSPVLGGAGTAVAESDADGQFVLQHASGKPGAEVGSYLVELRSPTGMEQEFYSTIPSEYTDGSSLSTTIPDDGGTIELILKKGKRRRS
ncbi:MAG: hypothetical protein KDB22_10360 [Planctomycetales bacterium]|nr:hypothetical protein [Planctomycetales bacterium]